jgi:endonuclease/exonuclease/phosphatase (EEP) superfamily protein YafD
MPSRFAALLALLLLAGCVSIPDGVKTRTVRSWEPDKSPAQCHLLNHDHARRSLLQPALVTLDPKRIQLLIWNMFKARRDGWAYELIRYATGQDLLLLQEVSLGSSLVDILARAGMTFDLAVAFEKQRIPTGVMTASRALPEFACAQRTMEPFLWLPKTTLISRYPLAGSQQQLVVANIHAVNFTFGTAEFRIQLRQLADILAANDGPLIVAGDFNTWSAQRLMLVHEILVERLQLKRVALETDSPSSAFGHPLDHAFYRGLRVLGRWTEESETSDHNPIWVEFALDGEALQ